VRRFLNPVKDSGAPRSLRFARNDKAWTCLCEERSDEAISLRTVKRAIELMKRSTEHIFSSKKSFTNTKERA